MDRGRIAHILNESGAQITQWFAEIPHTKFKNLKIIFKIHRHVSSADQKGDLEPSLKFKMADPQLDQDLRKVKFHLELLAFSFKISVIIHCVYKL